MRVAIFALLLSCGPRHLASPCANRGTEIVVQAGARRLWLCSSGAGPSYPVQLGRGGTGKRAEGDGKTPLGKYPLGAPRESKYCLFVPVAYPTEAQRREGFTGGAIGIHGPPKSTAWLGRLRRPFDWTRGCIAVATEKEIAEIAAWVEDERPAEVTIEP